MERANEKMYGKLLNILNAESRTTNKNRNRPHAGPMSLNVAVRRDEIKKINEANEVISQRLSKTQCRVPSITNLSRHAEAFKKRRSNASNRLPDGSPKLDPMILKKNQFEAATSKISLRKNSYLAPNLDTSRSNTLSDANYKMAFDRSLGNTLQS